MIYRAVIEGGNPFESYHVFFSAHSNAQASERLPVVLAGIFPSAEMASQYDCYNCWSEWELRHQSLGPESFTNAHLVESGCHQGAPSYINPKQCIIYLVGREHAKVLNAIKQIKSTRGRIDD